MHTPGPWLNVSHNDRWLVMMRGLVVATVLDGPEATANARLIAAAPDLLAELKGLVAANEAHRNDPTVVSLASLRLCESDARAAIAKAEGK